MRDEEIGVEFGNCWSCGGSGEKELCQCSECGGSGQVETAERMSCPRKLSNVERAEISVTQNGIIYFLLITFIIVVIGSHVAKFFLDI